MGISDKLSGIVDTVGDKIGDGIEYIKRESAEGGKIDTFIDKTSEKIAGAKDAVVTKAKEVSESDTFHTIKDKAGDAAATIKDKAGDVVDGVKSKIGADGEGEKTEEGACCCGDKPADEAKTEGTCCGGDKPADEVKAEGTCCGGDKPADEVKTEGTCCAEKPAEEAPAAE
jgi:hypothetical protein